MARPTTAAARPGRAPGAGPRPRVALCLTLGAGVLLGACGTPGPDVAVVEPALGAAATDRFDENGLKTGYTSVVPRAWVDGESLEADAPETYTVVRGDTLWDISDRFLKEPWRWTEIWKYNPQIANPHLIYPGDEIALEYVDGKPTLVLTRNGRALPLAAGAGAAGTVGTGGGAEPRLGAATPSDVTRLSPRVRVGSLNDAVPTIPGEAIRQFLVHPRVVDLDTIRRAPYVVGNEEGKLISASGNRVYARGALTRDQTRYGVFRQSESLTDPVSGELLGYEVTHVADARLLNVGDPSTLAITDNRMETIAGDILLPVSSAGVPAAFEPRLPEIRGEGRIVSLVDAISQTGRNQVVVLNVGQRAGIEIGDVLAVETRGGSLIDPRGRGGHERVPLPNTRTGVVMVFETFDKVSYALVMESTRPVRLGDIVTGI